jgi:Fe-S oxidoreductase
MTVTYDPSHPKYYDVADLRAELTRVYDLCHGCRLCYNLCPSFPTLFNSIDGHDGDVHQLSTDEQDKVVDECYGCKLCYVKCPYVPPHEWQLDFPRLMLRAVAVRKHGKRRPLADQLLGRTDLLGKVSTSMAPLVNAATGTPGTLIRKAMEKTVGLASERLLPPYAGQRFSTWFKRRSAPTMPERHATVALFPTCFVEYNAPAIGHDLVKVYEHREEATASVHYVRFSLAPAQVRRFRAGPASLAVHHPAYDAVTVLGDITKEELAADLGPQGR